MKLKRSLSLVVISSLEIRADLRAVAHCALSAAIAAWIVDQFDQVNLSGRGANWTDTYDLKLWAM